MDPQLRAQLRQTIHVATLASVDAAGDPTFSSPVPMDARVEDDRRTEYARDEAETTSRKRVVTEGQIRLTDRIWLPGDSPADATLARTPMSVQELPDELGVTDHFETIV